MSNYVVVKVIPSKVGKLGVAYGVANNFPDLKG